MQLVVEVSATILTIFFESETEMHQAVSFANDSLAVKADSVSELINCETRTLLADDLITFRTINAALLVYYRRIVRQHPVQGVIINRTSTSHE